MEQQMLCLFKDHETSILQPFSCICWCMTKNKEKVGQCEGHFKLEEHLGG